MFTTLFMSVAQTWSDEHLELSCFCSLSVATHDRKHIYHPRCLSSRYIYIYIYTWWMVCRWELVYFDTHYISYMPFSFLHPFDGESSFSIVKKQTPWFIAKHLTFSCEHGGHLARAWANARLFYAFVAIFWVTIAIYTSDKTLVSFLSLEQDRNGTSVHVKISVRVYLINSVTLFIKNVNKIK